MMTPKMKEDSVHRSLEQAGSSSFRAGSQRSAGKKGRRSNWSLFWNCCRRN